MRLNKAESLNALFLISVGRGLQRTLHISFGWLWQPNSNSNYQIPSKTRLLKRGNFGWDSDRRHPARTAPYVWFQAVWIVLSYQPLETVLSKHSTPFEVTPKSA
jgi:hypothetical protein